jgi:hypothetical protein
MINYTQIYNNPGPTGVQLNVFLGGDRANWINVGDGYDSMTNLLGGNTWNPINSGITGPITFVSDNGNKILSVSKEGLSVDNCDGNIMPLNIITNYPDFLSYAEAPNDNTYGYGYPLSIFKDVFSVNKDCSIISASRSNIFHAELFYSPSDSILQPDTGFNGYSIFSGIGGISTTDWPFYSSGAEGYDNNGFTPIESYVSGIFKLNSNLQALSTSTDDVLPDIICGIRYNRSTTKIDFFINGTIYCSQLSKDSMQSNTAFTPFDIGGSMNFNIETNIDVINNTWGNNRQSQCSKVLLQSRGFIDGIGYGGAGKGFTGDTERNIVPVNNDIGILPSDTTSFNTYLVKQGCYVNIPNLSVIKRFIYPVISMFTFPNSMKICNSEIPQYMTKQQILDMYSGMY